MFYKKYSRRYESKESKKKLLKKISELPLTVKLDDDYLHETPLQVAIETFSRENIRIIVDRNPHAVWSTNENGETPFSLLLKRDPELAEVIYKQCPPRICYVLGFDGTLTSKSSDDFFAQYKTLFERMEAFNQRKVSLLPGVIPLLNLIIDQGNIIINSNNYSSVIRKVLKNAGMPMEQLKETPIFGQSENLTLHPEQTGNGKFLRIVELIKSEPCDVMVVVDDDKEFIASVKKNIPKCTTFCVRSTDHLDNNMEKIFDVFQLMLQEAVLPTHVFAEDSKLNTSTHTLAPASFFQAAQQEKEKKVQPPTIVSRSEKLSAAYLYRQVINYAESSEFEKALPLLYRAADQGNCDAQLALAQLLTDGSTRWSIKKDVSMAIYYYTLAAERGNDKAQFILGQFYYLGVGVKEDLVEAKHWFQLADKQENRDAKNALTQLRKVENDPYRPS